jgi:glycosyltransferase involved in cell wall biosynthesis
MSAHPKYTIIAPIYNEQEVLPELYKRVSAVMDQFDGESEFVLVNDGSRDRSFEILQSLAAKDSRVKVINFSRNFGHQMAITAGIDYASGDAIVIIDADLQDPPEVIHDLIVKWKEGADIVLAVRSKRLGETWFKKLTATLFYRVIDRMTDLKIPLDTGDFRLMDRKVVDALKQIREHHRFMRGLSVWVGYKKAEVRYVRQERFAGETKYPLKKMIRFATDGITSFSYVPLQLATTLGFICAMLAFVSIPAIIVLRAVSGIHFFEGQASTLASLLLLGGIQLIFLGIIGEYLGRIYNEVKRRPLYLVADLLNFEQSPRAETRPTLNPPAQS